MSSLQETHRNNLDNWIIEVTKNVSPNKKQKKGITKRSEELLDTTIMSEWWKSNTCRPIVEHLNQNAAININDKKLKLHIFEESLIHPRMKEINAKLFPNARFHSIIERAKIMHKMVENQEVDTIFITIHIWGGYVRIKDDDNDECMEDAGKGKGGWHCRAIMNICKKGIVPEKNVTIWGAICYNDDISSLYI